MKKKVEFSSIEPELKKQFNLLMTHPEAFNLEEEQVQNIKELSSFAKRAGWKIIKKDAMITLAKQNSDELALAVIDDLEEDGVTIASKRSLELLLENPDNPEFHLEEEMIGHIKSLTSKEINSLKHALAHDLDIDEAEAESKSIGQKILDTFKLIWSGLAPIFSSLVIKLTAFAGAAAEKAIEGHLNGELGKELGDGTDKIIESIGLGLAGAIKSSVEEEKESKKKSKEESKTKEKHSSLSMSMMIPAPKKAGEVEKIIEKAIPKLEPAESLSLPVALEVSGIHDAHIIGEINHEDT